MWYAKHIAYSQITFCFPYTEWVDEHENKRFQNHVVCMLCSKLNKGLWYSLYYCGFAWFSVGTHKKCLNLSRTVSFTQYPIMHCECREYTLVEFNGTYSNLMQLPLNKQCTMGWVHYDDVVKSYFRVGNFFFVWLFYFRDLVKRSTRMRYELYSDIYS